MSFKKRKRVISWLIDDITQRFGVSGNTVAVFDIFFCFVCLNDLIGKCAQAAFDGIPVISILEHAMHLGFIHSAVEIQKASVQQTTFVQRNLICISTAERKNSKARYIHKCVQKESYRRPCAYIFRSKR